MAFVTEFLATSAINLSALTFSSFRYIYSRYMIIRKWRNLSQSSLTIFMGNILPQLRQNVPPCVTNLKFKKRIKKNLFDGLYHFPQVFVTPISYWFPFPKHVYCVSSKFFSPFSQINLHIFSRIIINVMCKTGRCTNKRKRNLTWIQLSDWRMQVRLERN